MLLSRLASLTDQASKLQARQWLKLLLIAYISVMLHACSTLPTRQALPPSYHQTDTQNTTLGRLFAPQAKQHTGLTGYHMLYQPIDAIAARLLLIEKAQKSIDLQYYIWQNDKIGALAWDALLRAADRGVKVRLLLDDNNSTKDIDASLLAFDQHPNIEVRLFNPFVHRTIKVVDYLTDFKRTNRRMHNKTFIIDGQVALIGGRNMSNQYYDAGETFQFSDIDVFLAGAVLPEISKSFDDYWNYPMAYPVDQVINAKDHRLTLASMREQLAHHRVTVAVQNYLNLTKEQAEFNQWLQAKPQLEWVKAHLVHDAPEKIDKDAKPEEHLTFQMQHIIGQPQRQVDIISAYFVPSDQGKQALIKLRQQDVKIRILTNSYAATDVGIVHAFYGKNRKTLLSNGIEIYEFLPVLKNQKSWRNKNKSKLNIGHLLTLGDSSDASLHAKMMTVDQQQVFIGSFNFDLRSANLNTEIGVILDSPKLASQLVRYLDKNIQNLSYRVKLNDKGDLVWEETMPDGRILIHRQEPNMNWFKRNGLYMISWLPLDGLM
jgi:putative cardiolipin synthase